eukprot:TRINITY_DN30092_c0_g4_i1.p2 TRINITY_DN30092_c0_g4~~TRINITY_DN30092_c0_g4_i1.p2  ORF type:complete len:263 (-),score=45.20 TRINITY_DN30092_c0_g4_i1:428-1216(-)
MMLGSVVTLPNTDPDTITQATISVLLKLMGQKIETDFYDQNQTQAQITMLKYEQPLNLEELKSEWDCDNWVTQNGCKHEIIKNVPIDENIAPIGKIQVDMKRIVEIFRKDENFQDLVSECLQKLLVPENVLSLTYNPIFGKLWRECCKRKEDDRFLSLADQLSSVVEKLGTISAQKREQLKHWIEESYNYLEENLARIYDIPEDRLSMGYLILDAIPEDSLPSKKDLRSITQFPTPGVLQAAQKILTQVIPTHTLPAKKRER